MDTHFDFNTLRTVVGFILSIVIVYTTLRFNHIKDIVDDNKKDCDDSTERLGSQVKECERKFEICQLHCENKREKINDKIDAVNSRISMCEKEED